jgi:hypothetical protein
VQNVHGLIVVEDDDLNRFFLLEATGKVTAAPSHFLEAVASLDGIAEPQDSGFRGALLLLNAALMNPEPIAMIALSISAVEALGQNEDWSEEQMKLLKSLAVQAEAADLDGDERAEIATRLRSGLHKLGLRQGVLRLLRRLDLGGVQKEWDRIYNLRSGLFHGTKTLTSAEIGSLANDSVSVAGAIVLTLARQLNIQLPAIASVHFPALTVTQS